MMITYDSSRVIAVTKINDRMYDLTQYDLRSPDLEITFNESYGGHHDSYIKMKDVEQNSVGNQYCVVYYDDGLFKIRVFG